MAATYCGKSCEDCPQKERELCPGCHPGPGRSWGGDCEIAVCCRDKGHASCDTCTNSRYCGKRSRRDTMIERRERKQAEEAERKTELARKAPILGKWLWILFWLWIPGAIVGVLTADVLVEAFPALAVPGEILSFCCNLVYGLILIRLTSECERYRLAGLLSIAAAAVGLLSAMLGGGSWTLILTLPAAVAGLVAQYLEFMAHGDVLDPFDREGAEKWRGLWKWFIGVYIALIGSVILMLIFPILGLLVALAALIGMMVVSVLKLVYLYRTAKTFRDDSLT